MREPGGSFAPARGTTARDAPRPGHPNGPRRRACAFDSAGPRRRRTLAALIWLLVAQPAWSVQSTWRGSSLAEALERLRAAGLPIVYSEELVRPEMQVQAEPAASDPRAVLDLLLAPHGLRVEPDGDALLVVAAETPPETVRITGAAVSRLDGAPVASASLRLLELGLEVPSHDDGRFELEAPPLPRYSLEARAPGFLPTRVGGVVPRAGALELTFSMVPEPFLSEEIDVRASRLSLLAERGRRRSRSIETRSPRCRSSAATSSAR
jgi:hypothetical protein